MAAEPILSIRRNFPRIDPKLIDQLRGFPTGYFVDIQGRRGAMDVGIQQMFDSGPVIGTAVTVRTVPDDNLTPYAALTLLKPGDVLIIGCMDWTGSAVVGDLILGMFKNAGVAGVVTDGAVRDIVGLEDVGVPIYARGLTANSPQKNGPGEIGTSVAMGGVTVNSGDLIVADRDGVVVLPHDKVNDAVAAVRAIKEKESKIEAAIAKGQTAPDWVKELVASDRTRFLD